MALKAFWCLLFKSFFKTFFHIILIYMFKLDNYIHSNGFLFIAWLWGVMISIILQEPADPTTQQ